MIPLVYLPGARLELIQVLLLRGVFCLEDRKSSDTQKQTEAGGDFGLNFALYS